MANSYYHAKSSAKKFGGKPNDYLELHNLMDSTKGYWPEVQHRAIFHSAHGIFLVEKILGPCILNSDGKEVATRTVAEQHVLEDFGWIPTLEDWLSKIPLEEWMYKKAKPLSKTHAKPV
ncbi:MAG: hypothetical protein FMNOHCHN_02052 [Ignavibacteriaceae bacterium]|nr:hypothetical protein [Ignavibacteriaceae bacterium]